MNGLAIQNISSHKAMIIKINKNNLIRSLKQRLKLLSKFYKRMDFVSILLQNKNTQQVKKEHFYNHKFKKQVKKTKNVEISLSRITKYSIHQKQKLRNNNTFQTMTTHLITPIFGALLTCKPRFQRSKKQTLDHQLI